MLALLLPVHERLEPSNRLCFEFFGDRSKGTTRLATVPKVILASILKPRLNQIGTQRHPLFTYPHTRNTTFQLDLSRSAQLPLGLPCPLKVAFLVQVKHAQTRLGRVVREAGDRTRYTRTCEAVEDGLGEAHEDRELVLGVKRGETGGFAEVPAGELDADDVGVLGEFGDQALVEVDAVSCRVITLAMFSAAKECMGRTRPYTGEVVQ